MATIVTRAGKGTTLTWAEMDNNLTNLNKAVVYSVKDSTFGAVGDGITDDTAAIQAAINSLQTNSSYRGGILFFPKGIYKISAQLTFTAYAAGQIHNMWVKGEGPNNTVLNFSTAGGGTNGIYFDGGAHFGVSDLTITNAKANGIYINGSATYCNFFRFDNLRIQFCAGSGIKSTNSYMGTFKNIWSYSNTSNGFEFSGYHTSLNCTSCYASDNTGSGWSLNGMTYSNFISCGGDRSGQQGWTVANCAAVKFSGSGAESNTKDGWYFYTSTASAGTLPTETQNIKGLVLDGCFGHTNSTAGGGVYANYVRCETLNSRDINLIVLGGSSSPGTVSDKALILNGASGTINFTISNHNYSGYSTDDLYVNSVSIKNLELNSVIENDSTANSFTIQQTKQFLLTSGVSKTLVNLTRASTGNFSALIEVVVDIQDNTAGVACYSRKYLYKFSNNTTTGFSVTAVTTAADYTLTQSTGNYAMSITPTATAVSATNTTFAITATTTGAIPWTNAKVSARINVLANQNIKLN